MNRVAVLIVNYNMPERADALAEHIQEYSKTPFDLYLIDNGSDIMKPAKYTTVRLDKNVQTTNGWLAGLASADHSGIDYCAYWFLITSAKFTEAKDPLTPMFELMHSDNDIVGVHPALTKSSTTHWKHLITKGGTEPRQVFMIDNIASLYRADWFDSIGRFDKRFVYGWGIDLETGYLARKDGKRIYVCEQSKIHKTTDIGYTMGRMGMDAIERRRLATWNMEQIFYNKYGEYWRDVIFP